MAGFMKLFGGNSQTQDTQPSLLADWQSYSKGDVESGRGAASSSTASSLFQNAEQGANKVGSFLTDSFTKVQSGITSGVSSVASGEAFT